MLGIAKILTFWDLVFDDDVKLFERDAIMTDNGIEPFGKGAGGWVLVVILPMGHSVLEGEMKSASLAHARGLLCHFAVKSLLATNFVNEIGRRDSTSKLASRARLRYVSLILRSLTIGGRSPE